MTKSNKAKTHPARHILGIARRPLDPAIDIEPRADQIRRVLTDGATDKTTRKALEGCLLEISNELEMGITEPELAWHFYFEAAKQYDQMISANICIEQAFKEIAEILDGAGAKRLKQILKRHKILGESPETIKPQLTYKELKELCEVIAMHDDEDDVVAKALLVLVNEFRRHRSDRLYIEDTADTLAFEIFRESRTFEKAAYAFAGFPAMKC